MHKIKKGDNVQVRTGRDAGKSGKVLQVFPELGVASVEGINLASKHLRRRSEREAGSKIEFPAPLPLSRLALVCPKCGRPTRVLRTRTPDGKGVRSCRRCQEVI